MTNASNLGFNTKNRLLPPSYAASAEIEPNFPQQKQGLRGAGSEGKPEIPWGMRGRCKGAGNAQTQRQWLAKKACRILHKEWLVASG